MEDINGELFYDFGRGVGNGLLSGSTKLLKRHVVEHLGIEVVMIR